MGRSRCTRRAIADHKHTTSDRTEGEHLFTTPCGKHLYSRILFDLHDRQTIDLISLPCGLAILAPKSDRLQITCGKPVVNFVVFLSIDLQSRAHMHLIRSLWKTTLWQNQPPPRAVRPALKKRHTTPTKTTNNQTFQTTYNTITFSSRRFRFARRLHPLSGAIASKVRLVGVDQKVLISTGEVTSSREYVAASNTMINWHTDNTTRTRSEQPEGAFWGHDWGGFTQLAIRASASMAIAILRGTANMRGPRGRASREGGADVAEPGLPA